MTPLELFGHTFFASKKVIFPEWSDPPPPLSCLTSSGGTFFAASLIEVYEYRGSRCLEENYYASCPFYFQINNCNDDMM